MSASNNGSITYTNGTLNTSGRACVGAWANTGATLTLGNTAIKTTGSSAPGLLAQNGSSMNGIAVKQAGARNLGEVKMGVDAKLNNTVNLWSNIGQQMGDKGYSDTSAMVGVKINF